MDLTLVSSNHSGKTLEHVIYDKMDDNTKQKVGEVKLESTVEVLFEGYDTSIYNNKRQFISLLRML